MKITDFQLQARGPNSYDHYLSKETIPSPIGSFVLSITVDDETTYELNSEVFQVLARLRTSFIQDNEALVGAIHKAYLEMCEHKKWMQQMGVPLGLPPTELGPYITVREINIATDEIKSKESNPGRVYLSPSWDTEHGLYFARIANQWVKTDV